MATTTSPLSQAEYSANVATASPGPSLWNRIENVFRAMRNADHDSAVERYINNHGGALTDDIEREISRRFGNMAGDR